MWTFTFNISFTFHLYPPVTIHPWHSSPPTPCCVHFFTCLVVHKTGDVAVALNGWSYGCAVRRSESQFWLIFDNLSSLYQRKMQSHCLNSPLFWRRRQSRKTMSQRSKLIPSICCNTWGTNHITEKLSQLWYVKNHNNRKDNNELVLIEIKCSVNHDFVLLGSNLAPDI